MEKEIQSKPDSIIIFQVTQIIFICLVERVSYSKEAGKALKYHKADIFTFKWKMVPDNFSTFPPAFDTTPFLSHRSLSCQTVFTFKEVVRISATEVYIQEVGADELLSPCALERTS